MNKIKNLLGPLKMCRCDLVLYCYSIVVLYEILQMALYALVRIAETLGMTGTESSENLLTQDLNLGSFVVLQFCSFIFPSFSQLLQCWIGIFAAVLLCSSAMDLQCYGYTELWCCSAMGLGLLCRGPSGPKKQASAL